MKILVAIESNNNAGKLAKTTLRWASRAGYDMRIFIPKENQLKKYQDAIDDVKYKEYLDLSHSIIVVGEKPKIYAKKNGYDLLVLLADDLKKWIDMPGLDGVVLEYAGDIGSARSAFGKNPKRKSFTFTNGSRILRV